jgi:hypothetical protein
MAQSKSFAQEQVTFDTKDSQLIALMFCTNYKTIQNKWDLEVLRKCSLSGGCAEECDMNPCN